MKKIISLAIIAMLALGGVSAGAYYDIQEDAPYRQAVETLTALGAVSGRAGGGFDPDGKLTRAEFCKLAVIIAGEEQDETGARFPDVTASHWANGYIGAAADEGLIIAFPDGKFRPDEAITCAQAVTVTLRLLGYTDNVVGGVWPGAYMAKASELGLTDGLSLSAGAGITRAECAVLLDNALRTDVCSASAYASKKPLIEKMGFYLEDECVVYASKSTAPSLLDGEIQTTNGKYTAFASPDAFVSKKGVLVTNKDGEVVCFIPSEQKVTRITSTKRGSHLTLSDSSAADPDDDTVFFWKGRQLSYSALLDDSDISWTDRETLVYLTQGGDIDYIYIAS